MQHLAYNSFGAAVPVSKRLHLKQESSNKTYNNQSTFTSDSEDDQNTSEEFNINFNSNTTQDFGLDYWIKHTNTCPQPPLPCHKSDKSVFNSKSSNCKSKETSLSLSVQKPKRSKKNKSISQIDNHNEWSHTNLKKIKYNNCDIPRLKIPKNVLKNYFKTLSSCHSSQSSSSESEFSLYSSQNEINRTCSKLKSNHCYRVSECKSSSSSTINDSSCLEKSFEKSNNSVIESESKSQFTVVNSDIMRLALTVDPKIYSNFLTVPRRNNVSEYVNRDIYLQSKDQEKEQKNSDQIKSYDISSSNFGAKTIENIPTLISSKSNCDSLSFCCDIPCENKKLIFESYKEESQSLVKVDSINKSVNNTPIVNNRKRNLDSLCDEDDSGISAKKKLVEPGFDNEIAVKEECEEKQISEMSPVCFAKFLIRRLKMYETVICEKYCLSQPNAMKFLAQNHATNWESNKNNLNQMHLVPCEFLSEIFHRALHCFGLEKKILKETMEGNASPINRGRSSHSTEYRKIRDEYSFSLKRVRYGIGVIDELFRRKVNYQNIPQNDDVPIVRKWKHIIYYVCLHAKSAFMAKEIQYHNYIQFSSSSFDGVLELGANNTPSIRCSSHINLEMYNKPQWTFQLPKESSKLFDNKLNQKITPDHFSHSDLEISPHSYDSGKGSSIQTSSNANSLVSGCHTTSSLNSTPHSIQEFQPSLPGFQLYRIDEYQMTANEYTRLLPEALQLHNKILSKIGVEPNANSRDNMLKLIYYMDICQEMLKDDLMNECLQRLLSQVMRF